MFVVIINFPPIKAGKDAEFQEWFAWSNKEFAKHKGFINRRLLKSLKGVTTLLLWNMIVVKALWLCIPAPFMTRQANVLHLYLTGIQRLSFMR